jgi:mannose-6-phosphate isomerase-like protein (cupin superfamily)
MHALGKHFRKTLEVNGMKKIILLTMVAIPLLAVQSQAPAPAGFEHWTAADLLATDKTLAAKAAADAHRSAAQTISDYPNDLYMAAHREADGVPEWHETQADVFFIESGTATLVVGGTMVNAETTAPHEKRNGTIEGGVRQKLSPGDVVRIPANTPHQVLLDAGQKFSYFVVKIKGY